MDARESVQKFIDGLPPAVQESPQAAAALLLAGLLPDASPREAAPLSRELRATLGGLEAAAALSPKEADPVDELEQRRRQRRGGSAVPAGPAGGQERS